jgi:hypothetical protein
MNRAIPLVLSLPLAAYSTVSIPNGPAGHQSTDEVEILSVMDDYMLEISANDLAAMKARQTPEGMTYRHRARGDGAWEVLARSNMEWVAPNMTSEQWSFHRSGTDASHVKR